MYKLFNVCSHPRYGYANNNILYVHLDLLRSTWSFTVVICYGIGHIGSCPIAQQQFALLLLILEEFKPTECRLYDPVLVKEERKAIEDSSCVLLTVNEVSLPSFLQSIYTGANACSQFNGLLVCQCGRCVNIQLHNQLSSTCPTVARLCTTMCYGPTGTRNCYQKLLSLGTDLVATMKG